MKKLTMTAAILGLVAFPSVALGSISDTPPPNCDQVWDPYDYTQSALATCGIPTYPLSSTTQLPDGGTSYNYDVADGATLSLPVPPAGFDPASASASELAMYGLSPRPPQTDLDLYAAWVADHSHLSWSNGPAWVADLHNLQPEPITPAEHVGAMGGWAGFEAFTSDKPNYFRNVDGIYTEPHMTQSACGTSQDASFWSGIGGEENTDWLAQEGTEFSNGWHHAWFELVKPDGSDAFHGALSLGTIYHGDTNDDYTGWDPSTEVFSGSVNDYSTGHSQGWRWTPADPSSTNIFTGDSAEVVLERASGWTNLADFGTWNVGSATINGSHTFNDYSQLSGADPIRYRDYLSYGAASTSFLASDGSYSVTWDSCQ